ncbi:MAG TPA: nitrilase-related carbon-nitrogen hydrolase [bacterium]
MKIAVIQKEISPHDPAGNLFGTLRMLESVAEQEIDLFVLSELFTTGVIDPGMEKDDFSEMVSGPTISALREFCLENGVHLLAGSIPVKNSKKKVTNTSYLIDPDGEIILEYSKVHLFDGLGEKEVFVSGDKWAACDINGIGIGVLICYDVRFPAPVRRLAQSGCEIILVPALWPEERINHWETLLRARAIENQVWMVGANGLANHNGTFFPGHSMIVTPSGEALNQPDMRESVIVRTANITQLRNLRSQICYLDDEIEVKKVDFKSKVNE